MSKTPRSLIQLKDLDQSEIQGLFAKANDYLQFNIHSSLQSASNSKTTQHSVSERRLPYLGETLALVFFENSTRTRMSFEAAAARLGFYPQLLDCNSGSSLEKGETQEDTLLNIAAMGPRAVVVRCGDSLDLPSLAKVLPCPIINAGWGMKGHPTQGLLDLFTILQHRQTLQDLRLLIVGDVYHSRVASSHFQLAEKLGFSIALAGPEHFMPKDRDVQRFSNLEEGLRWANVVMALRVQLERHQQQGAAGATEESLLKNYHQAFGLSAKSLQVFSKEGLILHPGPINWGIEMHEEVQRDSRQVILEQVRNGVFVRQAVIEFSLSVN